jgi:hypothetical protein
MPWFGQIFLEATVQMRTEVSYEASGSTNDGEILEELSDG